MAKKVSRDLLKGLVKECLVEILSEGLAGNTMQLTESTASSPARQTRQKPQRRAAPDLISMSPKKSPPQTSPALENRIKSAAGGDSLMESLLRDTAQNTLPGMLAADSKNSAGMAQRMAQGDAATKAMANTDPMDIFEGAGNWAELAFSSKGPR